MTKIFVLGGTGMLGHRMVRTLSSRFDCTFSNRDRALADLVAPGCRRVDDLDVRDWQQVERALSDLQPQVVINCVGVTTRKLGTADGVNEVNLNSLLPRRLAAWASQTGSRLFHISTDCVFSGQGGAYTEESPLDAQDLYGRSKGLGEVAGPGVVTLRGSIVGRELRLPGTELFEWCISQKGKSIKGYRKALYSGVTTNYLSHLIGRLIVEQPGLSGLYQVAGEPISKYDLLCKLNAKLDLNLTIAPDDSYVSDKTLSAKKLNDLLAQASPNWDDMLDQMISETA